MCGSSEFEIRVRRALASYHGTTVVSPIEALRLFVAEIEKIAKREDMARTDVDWLDETQK